MIQSTASEVFSISQHQQPTPTVSPAGAKLHHVIRKHRYRPIKIVILRQIEEKIVDLAK